MALITKITIITLNVGTDGPEQNAESDQGLHCLPVIQQKYQLVVKWAGSNFRTRMVKLSCPNT